MVKGQLFQHFFQTWQLVAFGGFQLWMPRSTWSRRRKIPWDQVIGSPFFKELMVIYPKRQGTIGMRGIFGPKIPKTSWVANPRKVDTGPGEEKSGWYFLISNGWRSLTSWSRRKVDLNLLVLHSLFQWAGSLLQWLVIWKRRSAGFLVIGLVQESDSQLNGWKFVAVCQC